MTEKELLNQRLLEAKQQIDDKDQEETPPTYVGPKIIFQSGIPGVLGGYRIVHTIETRSCGWEDKYTREPKKNGGKICVPYVSLPNVD